MADFFVLFLHLLQRLFCAKVTAEILRNPSLWKVVSAAAALWGTYCILIDEIFSEILQNEVPRKNSVARYSVVCLRYTQRDTILLGRKQPHSANFFLHPTHSEVA